MERMVLEQHWGYYTYRLKSGVQSEKGKLACLDTADPTVITKGAVSTTLIPIGIFMSTALGDGSKTVQVKLFHEIQGVYWNNDGSIDANDVGAFAYIKDDQTVTLDDSGASLLGWILNVDPSKGVLVRSTYPGQVAP